MLAITSGTDLDGTAIRGLSPQPCGRIGGRGEQALQDALLLGAIEPLLASESTSALTRMPSFATKSAAVGHLRVQRETSAVGVTRRLASIRGTPQWCKPMVSQYG